MGLLQLDLDEAKARERARRATLERVNKMLFHDTDAAKSFHSAAMHCDVLAERSAQIELKHQVWNSLGSGCVPASIQRQACMMFPGTSTCHSLTNLCTVLVPMKALQDSAAYLNFRLWGCTSDAANAHTFLGADFLCRFAQPTRAKRRTCLGGTGFQHNVICMLQVAALRKAQEEAFERQRREQVELAEDAELQRLREARERALEQKAGQMEQLEQLKASILAERAANKEAV